MANKSYSHWFDIGMARGLTENEADQWARSQLAKATRLDDDPPMVLFGDDDE